MARFPVQVFTRDNALVGYDDDYKSSPLARKFAGWPRGVYTGFVPGTTPGSPLLTLSIDPTEGVSIIKLPSAGDPGGIDLVVKSTITIDFTGHLTFPVNVVAVATYDDSGAPSAQLFTISPGTPAWNEVVVCQVQGAPLAMTTAINPALGQRTSPLAFVGSDFGYMPAGAVEDLQAAVDIVNEVVAARVGLDAVDYPSLSDRLAADLSAASMGARLGKVFRALRSNDYTVAANATEVRVAGSFSEVNRDFAPFITLSGAGSESSEGAVAAPNDSSRNVAIVVDSNSGYKIIDDDTNRRVIYGRLEGPTSEAIAGTFQFTLALATVTASDADLLAQVSQGDGLEGPDGKVYEVATVVDDSTLILRDAYQGPTTSSSSVSKQVWLLRFRKLVSGSETAAAVPAATTLHFVFPAFLTLGQDNPDWTLPHLTGAERPPFPAATTTLAGKVPLGTAGSLVGAVFVQAAGAPVAGGPFHLINFSAGGGQVQQTAPGVITVGAIGGTGAPGPPGASGGPGPAGATGPGFTALTLFETESHSLPFTPVPVPWSTTLPMGHTIRAVGGGFASVRDRGAWAKGADILEIDDISFSGSDATISGTITGDINFKVFLTSAGS